MVLCWLRTIASQVVELDRVTEFDSYIRGYHAYRDIWSPVVEEILPLKREPDNLVDASAVAVWKEDKIVGHVPYGIQSITLQARAHLNTTNCFHHVIALLFLIYESEIKFFGREIFYSGILIVIIKIILIIILIVIIKIILIIIIIVIIKIILIIILIVIIIKYL